MSATLCLEDVFAGCFPRKGERYAARTRHANRLIGMLLPRPGSIKCSATGPEYEMHSDPPWASLLNGSALFIAARYMRASGDHRVKSQEDFTSGTRQQRRRREICTGKLSADPSASVMRKTAMIPRDSSSYRFGVFESPSRGCENKQDILNANFVQRG